MKGFIHFALARSALGVADGSCDEATLLQMQLHTGRIKTIDTDGVEASRSLQSPWTLVLQYGEEPYTPTAAAVGVLDEEVTQFAKLADASINALPSGGESGYDYYKFTSDGRVNTTNWACEPNTDGWDTRDHLIFRTSNVGGYQDEDRGLGLMNAEWSVCSANDIEDCTSWRTGDVHSNFDIRTATTNTCSGWYSGHYGRLCNHAYGNWQHDMRRRCFNGGGGWRTNVKIYKLTSNGSGSSPTPEPEPKYDCALSAYWEFDNCGCGGNDQNQNWCGGIGSGNCPDTIETSICASGTAYLAEWHPKPYGGSGHAGRGTAGHLVRDGCEYIWHAQYACQDQAPAYTQAASDTRCPRQHEDRLFRNPTRGSSGITLEECYAQCLATEGCNHFSHGAHNNGGTVCMGCTTLANAQTHAGFTAYDMA